MHEDWRDTYTAQNYKSVQLDHTAGEVNFSPPQFLPHPSSEFKPWNNVLCVLYCTFV